MVKSSVLLQGSQVKLRLHVEVFVICCLSTIIFNVPEPDIKLNCLFNVGVFKKQSKCLKSNKDCWSISKHQPLKQDDSRYFLLVNNLVRIEGCSWQESVSLLCLYLSAAKF